MHEEQSTRVMESFLDGTLSPAQMDELAEIVSNDPSTAAELADQAAMHTLVLALHNGVPPPPPWNRIAQRLWPETRLAAAPTTRIPNPWIWVPAAAAAAVFAGILGFHFLFSGHPETVYPEPLVSVAGGGSEVIQRGASVATTDTAKSLDLGGYCHVQVTPQSAVKLEGENKAEALFLEKGAVVCEVDRHIGAFSVHSEVGTVTVTGTKFSATLKEKEAHRSGTKGVNNSPAVVMTLAVAVAEGSVTVNHNGKNFTVNAGTTQVFTAEEPPMPQKGVAPNLVAMQFKMLKENKLKVIAAKVDDVGPELPAKIWNEAGKEVAARLLFVTDTKNQKLKIVTDWHDADKLKTGGYVALVYWSGMDSDAADGCLGRLSALKPLSGSTDAMEKQVARESGELIKEMREVYQQKLDAQKKKASKDPNQRN